MRDVDTEQWQRQPAVHLHRQPGIFDSFDERKRNGSREIRLRPVGNTEKPERLDTERQ